MLTNENEGDNLTVEEQQKEQQQQQQRSNMSALNEHDDDEEHTSEADYSKRSAKIEESVKELGQRLNSLKLKRTPSMKHTAIATDHDVSTNEPPYTSTPVLTPVKEHERFERGRGSGSGSVSFSTGNEKLLLMRQQLEENKARFARRSTSNKQLMQIVTKMKEKMGVTQQSLLETTELRRSMTDLTAAGSDPTDPRDRHRSATDLSSRGSINIDRERNKYLENRVRLLEKQLNKERNTVVQAHERISTLQRANEEFEQNSSKVQIPLMSKETSTDDVIHQSISDDFPDQVKLEMAKEIQNLQNLLAQHESVQSASNEEKSAHSAEVQSQPVLKVDDNIIAERLLELESTIEELRKELSVRDERIKEQEEDIAEKAIELNILNANVKVLEEKLANSIKNKPIFLPNDNDDDDDDVNEKNEMQQLKQKLDENNKAMIKLKLKVKQYEKQEKQRLNQSKASEIEQRNAHLELVNNELQQKITELEDEKGHWQLEQINEMASVNISKQQTEAIRLLEEQKLDLQEELTTLQQEKDSARVKSELTEAQMEEHLVNRVKELERENQEKVQTLEKKLSHYISENMELLDKIEKLSKSSSSAESIEIVERLTQQERAELEEFNKRLTHGESDNEDIERDATVVLPSLVSELTQTDIAPEVSESLAQLREESTELKNKIELFTNERREVLEKMERLSEENASLVLKLEELNRQNDELRSDALQWENDKTKLEKELQQTEKENEQLSLQVSESSVQKAKLSQELTSMQKSSEVVAALDTDQGATLFDKCEKSLSKLNSELEAYRKANDKNSKFHVSKKLAKEAKNVHMQLSELLQKVKEASNAVETVTVVETVVAVTAPNGKALAEYEQLTAQNRELKARVVDLQRELAELRDDESMLQHHAITATESRIASKSDSDNKEKEEKLQQELTGYEQQCTDLQSTVEDLRLQLEQAKLSIAETTQQFAVENTQLNFQLAEKDSFIHDLELKLAETDKETDGGGGGSDKELSKLQNELSDYEDRCAGLQDSIETLTEQLRVANVALDEKSEQIRLQSEEINNLNQLVEDFDQEINAKEMSHEKQIEHLTRIRRELEGKCDTYEGEITIFRTLIAEQKQQLIESYSESDHKMNLKLLELQQCNEEICQLRAELKEYQQRSLSIGEQLTKDLSVECETLRESLKVSKSLAAQQVNELSNKQETIETLNQQIIDFYKTMEDNANQAFDKEEDFRSQQKVIEAQRLELDTLRKGQEEQKAVVDKLLNELHTHKANIPQLEADVQSLSLIKAQLTEQKKNLELRCKDQREKLRKYAANLKKRTTEYHELEKLLKDKESVTTSTASASTTVATVSQVENLPKIMTDNFEQINDLKNRMETLTEQSEKLEQALTESKATISKLNDDLKHKIHINIENRDTIKKLMHELKEKTDEVLELKEKVAIVVEMTTTAPVLSEQTSDANADGERNLKEKLNLEMAETTRLENALKRANDEINEKDAQLIQMRQQLVELEVKGKDTMQQVKRNEHLLGHATEDSDGSNSNPNATISDLKRQLETKSTKFEKSKEVIKHRNATIQKLQLELRELRDKLTVQPEEEPMPMAEYKQLYESLQIEHHQLNERYVSDKAKFEQTISRLETLHDGIQAKLQEDMVYIESLESDNNIWKTKLAALEESMSSVDNRNADAFEHIKSLEDQLATYKIQSKRTEEDLVSQIKSLSEHDFAMSQEQQMAHTACGELRERLKNLQKDFDELSSKHKKLLAETQMERVNLDAHAATITDQLREELTKQNAELERVHGMYKAKLAAKATEFDEMECEMSEHMDRVSAEKRLLTGQLEKSQDDCAKHLEEIIRLCDSLHMLEQAKAEYEREVSWLRMQHEGAQHDQLDMQELRMQAMQDKTEIDNLLHQIESLTTNHNQEMLSLRQQLDDLDTLGQNQTDDQVFIETENKRLTDLLAEKQATLESYFERNGDLQRQLMEKMELLARLQYDLTSLQTEMTDLRQQGLASVGVTSPALPTLPASEIITAPSMFFDNDQAVPSPFDEIIQPRTIASQLGATVSVSVAVTPVTATNAGVVVPELSSEQPTIEDLQRNVSDLEKHAQDLETKLIARNQLLADYEDHIREYQLLEQQNRQQSERKFLEMQRELEDRDLQLRQLAATQVEVHSTEQQRSVELSTRLAEMETELRARNHEISQLRATLEERDRLEAINRQIQVPNPLGAQAPTLDMFFGTATGSNTTDVGDLSVTTHPQELGLPQAEPVNEEIIVPKKAYVCHPSDAEKAPGKTSDELAIDWGVDDDPWANAAESTIEQTTHLTNQSAASTNYAELEAQLQQQRDQIQQLQHNLQSSEQQKQELHVKSMKLMKKIKELKSQQQQSNLSDLDVAICDELKRQVDLLEAQLSEMRKSNETEALEKEKLKKRIDMLTAGNDRMSEMKEKQDRDVQMYQARIRELQNQINRLDAVAGGGGDQQQPGMQQTTIEATPTVSATATTTETPSAAITDNSGNLEQIADLQVEVQDLSHELEVLIQEGKSSALQSHDTINALQQQLSAATEAKIEREADMARQHQQLVAEQNALRNANQMISEELNGLKMQYEVLKQNYEKLLQQNQDLQVQLQQKDHEEQQQKQNQQSLNSNKIDEYVVQLQEKDSEIMHLKQRIDDLVREDQTEKLVLEILAKNQELQMFKLKLKQLEEEKQELIESMKQQTKESALTTTAPTTTETTATPSESFLELESANQQLKSQLLDMEAKTRLLDQEKTYMEEELRVLNDHIMNSINMEDKVKEVVLELDAKNIEIAELRKSLETKQASAGGGGDGDGAGAVGGLTQQEQEQIIEQKCTEFGQQWQDYMQQRESFYKASEMELRKQIDQLTEELIKLNSQQTTSAEHTSITLPAITKNIKETGEISSVLNEQGEQGMVVDRDREVLVTNMKKVLEEQEVEIVTLKEQLAIRSAEYGRLAAQYDPFKLQNSLASGGSASEDLQKKLDKALYMLHERDMRCEEMTIELGQLLNERDTLQLKLSNTLRQMESIKEHTSYLEGAGAFGGTPITATTTAFTDSPYKVTTTDAPYSSTTASGVAAATVASLELNQKLSQLQTVNHSKDKVIVEEREQRERDMGQLQKEVANFPPANISPQAIDTDLSQTNRSPSTALLHWLMGTTASNSNSSSNSNSNSSSNSNSNTSSKPDYTEGAPQN